MSSPASKRQRAVIGPRAVERVPAPLTPQQTEALKSKVDALPVATLQAIILAHASSQQKETLLEAVERTHQALIERERNRVINFDHFSKEAWYLLYKKYARLSGSREYEATFEVAASIEQMIGDINSQTTENSSFGTKLSAVETLRKIFKSTLLEEGQMGKQVLQNCYGWDDKFVDVLALFTRTELDRLCAWDDGRGPWIEKLQEVRDLAESRCVLERLGEAVDLVSGEPEEDENDDCEDEDEDEDEAAGA